MKTSIDGETLKTAIREAGYTVTSFAARLGVHKRMVYFYIEGRKLPSVSRLMDMTQILGVKAEKLIKNLE